MGLKKHSGHEVDLDATDELPALQLPESGDSHISTDVFPSPVVPAGMVDLADSLRDVEQRLQRKIERVSALEAEVRQAVEQASELRTRLQQQESAAASRESALQQELTESRAQLGQLREEHSTGQRSLGEARDQLKVQLGALTEVQTRLSQRSNEHAHASSDAADWRRRAERHYEALSTWQSYRAVSEAMLGESEQALHEAEGRHNANQIEERSRAAELDAQLVAARSEASRRIAGLEESVRRAEQAHQAQTEALRVASEHATSIGVQLGERDAALADLRAQLETARREGAESIAGLEESLAEAEGVQAGQMDALRVLTEQTVELRSQLESRDLAAAELQRQLDALREVEAEARRGAAVFGEQQRQIGTLQTDLVAAEARMRELESQLRQSAERVQRLESEAHASAALLGSLQQNMERLGRDDTGSRPVVKEPLSDLVRMLVRQDGGADVLYRLGRRTTIGRTPDNDVQIDTTFVSRHHAVLLCSADHCIVEDLNSTNGVLVNGRRIVRQILQDGDMLTVGKTEFRYQQRS